MNDTASQNFNTSVDRVSTNSKAPHHLNSPIDTLKPNSQGGSFIANKDNLLSKLKQQELLKEMNREDLIKYAIEADDDGGQIQQVRNTSHFFVSQLPLILYI